MNQIISIYIKPIWKQIYVIKKAIFLSYVEKDTFKTKGKH